MAAVSSLMAPPNLVHHNISAAAKPIAIPLNLSFQIGRPAPTFASAPLFLTSKHSRTRLYAVAEEVAVSTQETADAEPEEKRRLYVGNVRYSIESDQLRKIFEEHGAVESAEVIYKKEYKKSRGFAFVTMKTIEDANKAVEKLNGAEIEGFKLIVNILKRPLSEVRRGPEEFIDSPYKIYVENLAKKVNTRYLKEHFAERGNVLSANVPVNPKTLRNAGFGYVTFSSEEDRDATFRACVNSVLMGQKIRMTKL